jgi:gamma-glutamyl hercynylcysteine S-oxide synthase
VSSSVSDAARRLAGSALAEALAGARATTLARTLDRSDADWRVPQQVGVNPVAWELGHIAWFAEFWILRGPHALGDDGFVAAAQAPTIAGPDSTFDSARLAHGERWRIALPTRTELVERMARQLDACLAAIPNGGADDDALYFHRLALFHEDMHGEAFAWLRAALGWPAPEGAALPTLPSEAPLAIAAAPFAIGRGADTPGFSFDNEQPAATRTLAPFAIDAAPLTNGAFRAFVEAGGYDETSFWPDEAGRWRAASGRAHPRRWRRVAGAWQERWFDRWRPLAGDAPVIHVNAWEAEAYCRWAKRRLPSAVEWECAARDPRFRWGKSVWEWTADPFRPYPGFAAGPYADYSRPWFGDHRELRGGSFATHARLHHPSYRNFFTPDRGDVFAGFRTAATR